MTQATDFGAPHVQATRWEQHGSRVRTLYRRIAVKADPERDKIGNIFIPDTAREPSSTGVVVAIGSDVDVRVGDRVIFMKKAGQAVKVEDEDLVVMAEHEVLGVLVEGQIRALGTMVVIRPEPPDERVGLIFIPDPAAARARERLVYGTIVAMGPGGRIKDGERWPMANVRIGQKVLYFQNYVPEFEHDGQKYVTVADDSVRAVVEESE